MAQCAIFLFMNLNYFDLVSTEEVFLLSLSNYSDLLNYQIWCPMTNMVMIMMPPCYDLYNRRRSWLVRTQIYMTRWNAPKLYWQHAVICTMCIVQWYAVCITWRTLRKTHTVYLCIVLLCTLHDRIDCAKLYQQYFQFTDMHCTIVCRVQCTVLCAVCNV